MLNRHLQRVTPVLLALQVLATVGCASGQTEPHDPVAPELRALSAEFHKHIAAGHAPADFTPSTGPAAVRDGLVLIDATAYRDGEQLLRELRGLGLTEGSAYGRIASGWLPIGAVLDLGRLEHLRLARLAQRGTGRVG